MRQPIFKALAVTAIVATSAVAASAQTSFSDILGRSLTNSNGAVTINADGTISGELGGANVQLTWDVEDGLFCRQGNVGSNNVSRACQSIRISGSEISFVNQDGSVSSTYTIN